MNIILCGYGKMGVMLEGLALGSDDMQILGVVHPGLYESALDVPGKADVIIDFSYPGNLDGILERAHLDNCAVVIGTTGFFAEQAEKIKEASRTLRIMCSSNYSVGVAILKKAVAMVAPALKDSFDIEIVETHHNQKVDAPSGTALMLAEAIESARAGESQLIFGRHETNKRRTRDEIGIHSLRGGNKAGEHEVHFLGTDEELVITHRATSKRVFAEGAVKAAAFLLTQKPGFYTMKDVIII